jgi:hypothetical protein
MTQGCIESERLRVVTRLLQSTALLLASSLVSLACQAKTSESPRPPLHEVAERPPPAVEPTLAASADPETIEPKLSFIVSLGATRAAVMEGRPSKLPGDFHDPSVSIEIKPERTFTHAGLRFEYPRHFSFEAQLGETSSWILSGNDLKIMVFRFNAPVTLEAFVQQLIQRFGPSTTTGPLRLKLGDTEYEGRRLLVHLAQQELTQDVVALPTLSGKARLLVLQDEPKQAGAESEPARALLARTFSYEN